MSVFCVCLQLFAVSPKRHTTIRSVVGVFTEGENQVVSQYFPTPLIRS